MTPLDQLNSIIGEWEEPLTSANLVATISQLMRAVNKIKGLTGAAKKNMVIDFVKKITNETENPWDDFLPSIIDGLIDAEKGKLYIRKKPWNEWLLSCWASLKTRDLPYRSG